VGKTGASILTITAKTDRWAPGVTGVARRAGAKRISLFHFSPKYKGAGNLLVEEAMAAFNGRES